MSDYNPHWHAFRAVQGQPAREVARVDSDYNTRQPTTYIVEWEPDALPPRLAVYATANHDQYRWPKDGDRWLVGWLGERSGDHSDEVITVLLFAALQQSTTP